MLRCGLFWKAFGIVTLLFLGWQAIKLAIWAVKVRACLCVPQVFVV